ncbi:homoserine kinase [Anaerolineaceae bacterium oral taxon 439]|nr:homoserine kinase [Anaerolineaceae bacterium oral taxon 439]
MDRRAFTVRAPATTANLGPGFDAFGLALDLWNEVEFSFDVSETTVTQEGYAVPLSASPEENLVLKSFRLLCEENGKTAPSAVRLHLRNRIPPASGLGSSAAAIACGLVAANEAMGIHLPQPELVDPGTRLEGHPDNIAAALIGGLTVGAVGGEGEGTLIVSYPIENWKIAILKPKMTILTEDARNALPKRVELADAVFNLQRIPFLLSALCGGDETTLEFAMRDRLHQPYRLALIPGGREILAAAKKAGAAGCAVSGAGPSLIAFSMQPIEPVLEAMAEACTKTGTEAETFILSPTAKGAAIVADKETK